MRKNPHVRRGLRARRLHRRLARDDAREPSTRRAPSRARRCARCARAAALAGCRSADATSPSSASGRSAAKARSSRELLPEFERAHPGIRVEVQQLPWTAAHEKLLTAFAGDATARRLPARQHLDPGVRGARRARAARRARSAASPVDARRLLRGHLGHQRRRRHALRRPVVRRHAPAVLPHATCSPQAGFAAPPRDLGGMARACCAAVKAARGPRPLRDPAAARTNSSRCSHWRCSRPTRCCATAGARQFPQRRLPRALASTSTCSASGWAPPLDQHADRERVEEFGRGYFAFYITGPWNIGEFKRRLPPSCRTSGRRRRCRARTARARRSPAARASSLFRASRAQGRGVAADRFLSRAPSSSALPRAHRRPAAAAQRLGRSRRSRPTPHAQAFRDQLERVKPAAESARVGAHRARDAARRRARDARGRVTVDEAVAELDARADRILEKRRWMLARGARHAMKLVERAAWCVRRRRRCSSSRVFFVAAGARGACAEPHRLRHLRARRPRATCASSGCDNYARAAAATAVLEGAAATRSTSSSSACRCRSPSRSAAALLLDSKLARFKPFFRTASSRRS